MYLYVCGNIHVCNVVHIYVYMYIHMEFLICLVLKTYDRTTKHTNFVLTAPPWAWAGPLWVPLGPYGPA